LGVERGARLVEVAELGRHSRSDQASDRCPLGPNHFQHGCDQHRHGPQSAAKAAEPKQRSPAAPRRQGAGGGIENIPFLQTNADAATMFATFWIEEISAPTKFLQLQYVQTVFLNFPVLGANPVVNLTWPHVSVATLQKTFGGQ
jgi:hypothetical protein